MPKRRRPATAPDGSRYDFSEYYRRQEKPPESIPIKPKERTKRRRPKKRRWKLNKKPKKETTKTPFKKRMIKRFLQIAATGIITLTGLTINAVGNYGYVEKGMSYIPKITGHAEKGKFWDGIHEYQDLLSSIDNTVEFERNRFGLFPDTSIITEYWIGDDNAIRYRSGDGKKLLLTDKPTKQYVHIEDIQTLVDIIIKREDKKFM